MVLQNTALTPNEQRFLLWVVIALGSLVFAGVAFLVRKLLAMDERLTLLDAQVNGVKGSGGLVDAIDRLRETIEHSNEQMERGFREHTPEWVTRLESLFKDQAMRDAGQLRQIRGP